MTREQLNIIEQLPQLIANYGAMRYSSGFHSDDMSLSTECAKESNEIYRTILDNILELIK